MQGYSVAGEGRPLALARKQLAQLPARAIPGFRDHALKGEWKGYRAVRLNDAYRAIYIVRKDGSVETVFVEQVNKHDY